MRRRLISTDRRGLGAAAFAAGAGPAAWALHFMGSYALVALACTTGWQGMGAVLIVATVALALLALASAVVGYRGWRRSRAPRRLDMALNEPGSWRGFAMTSGIVLGLGSALSIVLQGAAAVVAPMCSQGGVIP
ncbi:MAG TPA: hypothetical protein VFT04_13200 [Gemmatimonadales bacterium]|nr:hypothetical protein [Gemmatimonadales bacterium]